MHGGEETSPGGMAVGTSPAPTHTKRPAGISSIYVLERNRFNMAKHVLVAEDDYDILNMVLAVLEDAGYSVSSSVGRKTLDAVKMEHPDVILMDYQMPEMDGISIAHHLQRDPDTADIPIIAMTAAGRAPIVCQQMDAAGCLGKPFDIDHLVDTVERIVHMTH